MGSRKRRRKTARIAGNHDGGAPSPVRSSALEENVQAIKRWEKMILLARSKAEQVSDWIACTAGSGPVVPTNKSIRIVKTGCEAIRAMLLIASLELLSVKPPSTETCAPKRDGTAAEN
jgi:hypothetical protein